MTSATSAASAPEAAPQRRSRVASSQTATPARSGRLSINTRPWSDVFHESRALGTTPLGNVRLPAGRVTLRFVDRDGVTHYRRITVPTDGHVEHYFEL